MKEKLLGRLGTGAAALCLLGLGPGCRYLPSSKSAAWAAYQEAAGIGDVRGQQKALIRLTKLDDQDPNNWSQLAKLSLQLGDYARAYEALNRAAELDRTDVETLSTLTQLSLLLGDSDAASRNADLLGRLSPDSPVITMVRASEAYRAHELDRASKLVGQLLQINASDPYALLLQTRILVGQNQAEKAREILLQQTHSHPEDVTSFRSLASISENLGNWREAAWAYASIIKINRRDVKSALGLINAALRAGDRDLAQQVTLSLLGAKPPRHTVDTAFGLWSAQTFHSMSEVYDLAKRSDSDVRVASANYFNQRGLVKLSSALLGNQPMLPVTPENAASNAVIAGIMVKQGQAASALRLLSNVLAVNPDELYALKERSQLLLSLGDKKRAILDAQRSVALAPQDPSLRTLLADAYQSSDDPQAALMVLWDAFHDLPGDVTVYSRLRNDLGRDGEAALERSRLDTEYQDQKRVILIRALSA